MEPVNVRTCSVHITFRACSSHGRPCEFFHTSSCFLFFLPQSIIFLLSTRSTLWCWRQSPVLFSLQLQKNRLAPARLFHVQISIYMNITQPGWETAKACLCRFRQWVTSPPPDERGIGQIALFLFPDASTQRLPANKIEVLIKGFKQLAHFHERAGLRIAAPSPSKGIKFQTSERESQEHEWPESSDHSLIRSRVIRKRQELFCSPTATLTPTPLLPLVDSSTGSPRKKNSVSSTLIKASN